MNLHTLKFIRTRVVILNLIICCNLHSFAVPIPAEVTSVGITGLIVDSETLLPISDAALFDIKNRPLGVSDVNGFFNVKVTTEAKDDIHFTLIIKKTGYELYTQKEHWARLGSDVHATYYLGLQHSSRKTRAFSELIMNKRSNTYEEVKQGFNKISEKIDFERKIENAKVGNSKLFFKIDGNYYLISESGWLKLSSANDSVLIDRKKTAPANEINGYVKRSKVKRMSPLDNHNTRFEIYTK